MEELIKQQLQYYSNSDYIITKLRKITLPRYDKDTSFAQLSNWTNSDKFYSSRLPRISSQLAQKQIQKIERQQSYSESNCYPIKQMEINLLPISNNYQSYCLQSMRSKNKRTPRHLQFIADQDRQRRKSGSNRLEILSTAKIQQILKKKKESRFMLLHQQYLRTTQIIKNLEQKKKQ